MTTFDAISVITFGLGSAAILGTEPAVMGAEPGQWYRCICRDRFDLKVALNIRAISPEEAAMLAPLGMMMFELNPFGHVYPVGSWKTYVELLDATHQPQQEAPNDDPPDDHYQDEYQHVGKEKPCASNTGYDSH